MDVKNRHRYTCKWSPYLARTKRGPNHPLMTIKSGSTRNQLTTIHWPRPYNYSQRVESMKYGPGHEGFTYLIFAQVRRVIISQSGFEPTRAIQPPGTFSLSTWTLVGLWNDGSSFLDLNLSKAKMVYRFLHQKCIDGRGILIICFVGQNPLLRGDALFGQRRLEYRLKD